MSQTPNVPSPNESGNNYPPEGQNPYGAVPPNPYGQPVSPQAPESAYPPPESYGQHQQPGQPEQPGQPYQPGEHYQPGQPVPPNGAYPPPSQSGFPPPPPAGAYPPPAAGGFPPPPPVQPPYGAPGPGYGAPGYQQAYGAQAPSVGDAFNWGWRKFTQNVGAMVLGVLALMVPALIGFIIIAVSAAGGADTANRYGELSAGAGFGAFLGFVIIVLGAFLVQLGIYRASLDISQGRTVTFGTFFNFQDVGKVILAALLLGAATSVAGLLTFFIGGLGGAVVGVFGQFTLLFVLDKSLSPVEALKASMGLVNKNLGTVVLLYLGVWVASFLGAIFLGVGLLVALPVSMLATAYMYRRLQGEPVAA